MVGDRVALVALALFVTEQTGNPTDVGVVLAASTAPLVACLLLGGVAGDRFARKRIMIAADLVRFGLHGLLAALAFEGTVSVATLVAIRAGAGLATAFFQPAYSGLIPQTVPEELIQRAQGLTAASATLAGFVGPAVATAMVFGPGAAFAFGVDAATFLASAVLLIFVHPRPRGAEMDRSGLRRELLAGYREVRSRGWIWVTIVVSSLGLLVGIAPWYVLGPSIAADHYGTASVYGVALVLIGAGSIAGAAVGIRWRPARPMRAAFLATFGFPCTAAILAVGAPPVALFALAALTGAGWTLFTVWWQTAIAELVPPAVLSRVTAYDWMGSLALLPLGLLLAGPAAALVGGSIVLAVGGGMFAVLMAIGLAQRETVALRAR